MIFPKDRMFWHHVCKYNWSVVMLSCNSPHSMFPMKPCTLLSSLRPQAPLASLLYLLRLRYVCNPLTTSPTSTLRGSLKLLSFFPFPPKSILAICPLLSFMFHLRELILCLDCYYSSVGITIWWLFQCCLLIHLLVVALVAFFVPWWQLQTLPHSRI